MHAPAQLFQALGVFEGLMVGPDERGQVGVQVAASNSGAWSSLAIPAKASSLSNAARLPPITLGTP